MSYCRIHGGYSDLEDGCPSCRDAEERAEADRAATLEQISELAWRTRNPGDYECPHCKYIALRRQASRCPLCHGKIGPDYWAEIAERERAAEIAAREQAERRAKLEAEQRQREAAQLQRRRRIAVIALVCIVLVVTFNFFVAQSSRTRSHGPASAPQIKRVVSASRLNLRSCPSTTDCVILRALPVNASLEVIEERGEWFRVRVMGSERQEGWVNSSYTRSSEIVGAIAAVTDAPATALDLVGTWDGTIAGYQSTVTFSEVGGGFTVVGSMEKANRPTEDWQITDVSGRHLTIYRPDDDAQLSLSLSEHSGPPCLTGQYLEPGSSRPIVLCRRSH